MSSQVNAEGRKARPGMPATTPFAHDFSRIPARSNAPFMFQAKLTVNTPGDIYEQEADRFSERVMSMREPQLQRACKCGGSCLDCQNQEDTHKHLQAKHVQANGSTKMSAPPIVQEVLGSSGQSLDSGSRAFMESRFGQDFSEVRVHTDAQAAQAAQAVQARAYTVGRDIVFGPGEYAPGTTEGQRLLAHELTHVMQQTGSTSTSQIQRTPDDKQKRKDVVIVGEDWAGGEELSRVLGQGGQVIKVKSVDEAAAELAKINFPVGTLYIVTHSAASGALRFGKDEKYTDAADIAAKLKGKLPADNAPNVVDFRGCSVGTSPKAMDQIRAALGAKSVLAGTCYAVIQRNDPPIKIDNKYITKASDVTDKTRATFRDLKQRTYNNFGDAKECIVNKADKDFFAAGGKFVALWFNSSFTAEFIPGKSVCYKDVTPQKVDADKATTASQDCRLIQVDAKTP
jgi:hypothetical protein